MVFVCEACEVCVYLCVCVCVRRVQVCVCVFVCAGCKCVSVRLSVHLIYCLQATTSNKQDNQDNKYIPFSQALKSLQKEGVDHPYDNTIGLLQLT